MTSKSSREVKVGMMTYQAANGAWTTAMLGETVDVHADDAERFDRLNGPAVTVEPVEGIDDLSAPGATGETDPTEQKAAADKAAAPKPSGNRG